MIIFFYLDNDTQFDEIVKLLWSKCMWFLQYGNETSAQMKSILVHDSLHSIDNFT